MTSEELADKVMVVCIEANQRILVEGDQQYVTTEQIPEGNEGLTKEVEIQRWETDPLSADLRGLEEELLDTINHAAMSVLKIRRLRGA